MSRREAAAKSFLGDVGWAGASVTPLAADASFRRYDRIRLKDRDAVLMDAPPPREDVRPFSTIGKYLTQLGFSAPRILAEDARLGFLLLEDLGDETFTRVLHDGGDDELLYASAIDVLIRLHQLSSPDNTPPDIPMYDMEKLLAEAQLFVEWYLPAVSGEPSSSELVTEWDGLWRNVMTPLANKAETLVLRDYHVDNLMWLPGRPGAARCGLLDFQDAVVGPRAYDVMSLLEDARRDIAPSLYQRMLERYLQADPSIDADTFQRDIAILGAGRHAKVIGIFTRLSRRDHKHGYLEHIPRVWGLLERSLRHPVMKPIADWLDEHIPAPKRLRPKEPTDG